MRDLAAIELTEDVAYPVSDVWRALTDATLVEKWWAPNNIEPVVDHEFTLDMGGFGQQRCRVLEVEPEKLFSYTFGEGLLDTTIAWELEPVESGTRIHFEQARFDLSSPVGETAFKGMSGGWPQILHRIEGAIAES